MFEEWCEERNIDETLASMSDADIDSNVARFLHKVVKDGKTPYHPILSTRLLFPFSIFLKENGRPDVNFFQSPVFDRLRKSFDARMKAL